MRKDAGNPVTVLRPTRTKRLASHFLHEFDCDALAEFVVCSYKSHSIETLNQSAAIDISLDEERRIGKRIKIDEERRSDANRVEHWKASATVKRLRLMSGQMNSDLHQIDQQRALWADMSDASGNDGSGQNLAHSPRFDGRNRLADTRVAGLSWRENHGRLREYEPKDGENIKDRENESENAKKANRSGQNQTTNYQAFDLFGKLQLAFLSFNLLLFVFLCIRLNKKRNARIVQKTSSSTHVRFENYDQSLRFGQLDSI